MQWYTLMLGTIDSYTTHSAFLWMIVIVFYGRPYILFVEKKTDPDLVEAEQKQCQSFCLMSLFSLCQGQGAGRCSVTWFWGNTEHTAQFLPIKVTGNWCCLLIILNVYTNLQTTTMLSCRLATSSHYRFKTHIFWQREVIILNLSGHSQLGWFMEIPRQKVWGDSLPPTLKHAWMDFNG